MPSLHHTRYHRILSGITVLLGFIVLLSKVGSRVSAIISCRPIEYGSSISIANDTLGYQKIFVVNAPWRTDRKDAMSLAAAYSKLKLEWVNGVQAETMHEKAYPPGNHRVMNSGNLGSWRAHMDAMREIVVRNLTTALILEDDVDWDFRIRTQLLSFGHAVRKLSSLAQALENEQDHPPAFETKTQNPIELAQRSSLAIVSTHLHDIVAVPYSQDWDVLWLGHCGADLPPTSPTHPNRLMLLDDMTVPAPKHLRLRESSPPDPISALYPPHTRVYHHTSNNTLCTLAYAVTQRGARKILFELGVRDLSKGFDFALSDLCGGLANGEGPQSNDLKRELECVTVQPPLFSHYWDERGKSDIMGLGNGGRPETGSRYVIRSVRANLEGLGEGHETLFEQWSD